MLTLELLKQHAPFLSEENDETMDERFFASVMTDLDWADFAVRTCTCGTRFDGFDEYYDHLLVLAGDHTHDPVLHAI